ncbi:STAS domain-containing protein [Streptomyces sp. TRM64462]|uniref:STAS domain-containing protein n=1 Tax=Streptomyces sp. TRM64462 TaxID=2741726 RepID=UPI001586D825|nr:STAS domain-containing protein [Streptomyces sp. TRM64462]
MDDTDPIVLRVAGVIEPADVPRLCAALTALLKAGEGLGEGAGEGIGEGSVGSAAGAPVVVDAAGLVRPGLAAVDALARLHLTARRLGHPLSVRNAAPDLRALLALVGLADRLLRPPAGPGGRTAGTSASHPGTT